MVDDGAMVTLTQAEIVGRVHRLLRGGGNWDFPWTGPRLVYVRESKESIFESEVINGTRRR